MTTILQGQDSATGQVLYMALELSNKKWRLGFSNAVKTREVTIEAGDLGVLGKQIALAREKLKLAADCRVVSCYEAGRDGFWLHRYLVGEGIENRVVDSASIEVNRRQRRTKTDSVDVQSLLRLLLRYIGGDRKAMSVIRVPTIEEEDLRRLHRERERLVKERGAHSARIKSLMVAHGVRIEMSADFLNRLERFESAAGYALGEDLKGEIRREFERYALLVKQIDVLESQQRQRAAQVNDGVLGEVNRLMLLKSVGWQTSWVLVMEFFGWREFRNRRELGACAGLTPTPYSSGESEREQGISKAGNRRVRRLMVELGWAWLRYQPDSALSQWYVERYGHGGKRMRRIGIVALARKLLIALWRYLKDGVIPDGAVLKAV